MATWKIRRENVFFVIERNQTTDKCSGRRKLINNAKLETQFLRAYGITTWKTTTIEAKYARESENKLLKVAIQRNLFGQGQLRKLKRKTGKLKI